MTDSLYPRRIRHKILGNLTLYAGEELTVWQEKDTLVIWGRGLELVVPFQEMRDGTWQERVREFGRRLKQQRKVDRATKKANSKWLWKHYYD